jgi:hypothetical protein
MWRRNSSPLEMWLMPKCFAITVAWVPFPDPGGPINSIRMTQLPAIVGFPPA